MRYAPAGHVTSLTKELFKATGSFEFEKRLSTSVRRSFDSRHRSGRLQVRAPRPVTFPPFQQAGGIAKQLAEKLGKPRQAQVLEGSRIFSAKRAQGAKKAQDIGWSLLRRRKAIGICTIRTCSVVTRVFFPRRRPCAKMPSSELRA